MTNSDSNQNDFMSEMLAEIKQRLIGKLTNVIKQLEPDCPDLTVTVSDDLSKIYIDGVSQEVADKAIDLVAKSE